MKLTDIKERTIIICENEHERERILIVLSALRISQCGNNMNCLIAPHIDFYVEQKIYQTISKESFILKNKKIQQIKAIDLLNSKLDS